MEPVKVGLSDGINTELVDTRTLTEGMQVITGQSDEDDSGNDSDRRSGGMFPGGRGPGGGGPPPGF